MRKSLHNRVIYFRDEYVPGTGKNEGKILGFLVLKFRYFVWLPPSSYSKYSRIQNSLSLGRILRRRLNPNNVSLFRFSHNKENDYSIELTHKGLAWANARVPGADSETVRSGNSKNYYWHSFHKDVLIVKNVAVFTNAKSVQTLILHNFFFHCAVADMCWQLQITRLFIKLQYDFYQRDHNR